MKRKASSTSALESKIGKTRAQTSFGPSDKIARGDPFWDFLQRNGLSLCTLRRGEFGTGILIENLEQFERNIAEQVRSGSVGLERFISMFQDSIVKAPETLEVMLCPLSCTRVTTVNPSIIRVFLGIEEIQMPIIDCLLEQLILSSTSVTDNDEASASAAQYQRIIHLIISHLQWLNVRDPEGFTERLINVVESISSNAHKSELILALPTIVEESFHQNLYKSLLLQIMNDLPSVVLEALSHLTLSKEIEKEVADRSLGQLSAANPRDLPAVVSFILNSVTLDDPVQTRSVADTIREKISLEQICSQKSRYSFDTKGFMDGILFSLRTNKLVASSFLESLSESFKTKKDIHELDVFIILGLFSVETMRKKVVKLLESGASAIVDSGILRSSIIKYASTLRSLFSDMLSLAELILRTASKPAKPVGKEVYTGLLVAYPDTHETRNVLSFIITHLSPASSDIEVSLALSVLEEGALAFPRRLERFPTIFREIVERLDRLSFENVKRFYYVYACLAFVKNADNEDGPLIVNECVFPDVSLVLQKQASNVDETYKKIGACGAVSIIRRTGPHPGNAKDALSAFKVMKKYSSPRSLAFFYDELTKLIVDPSISLSQAFLGELSRELPDELIKNFMVSKKEDDKGDNDEDEEEVSPLWYNNLGRGEGYSVSIYPLVKSYRRDSLLTLCPLFKLVSSCEKASGVSALLNSPLVMFTRAYSGPQSDRRESEAIAFSLFHAIRWMRELLNVFHSSCFSDPDSGNSGTPSNVNKAAVIKRLYNLCELNERYTNVSKEWASPKLPGPPLPLPVPTTIPKRMIFKKVILGRNSDMSFRELELGTVLDLLRLLNEEEDDFILNKSSAKIRFLLSEVGSIFSKDESLTLSYTKNELVAAASVFGKLLPRYVKMLNDIKEHNASDDEDVEIIDSYDLKVSVMYVLNFINKLIATNDTSVIKSLIGENDTEESQDGSYGTTERCFQVLFKKYQKLCVSCTKIEIFSGFINIMETLCKKIPEFRVNISRLCEKFIFETGEGEEVGSDGNFNEDYIRFIVEHYVQFSVNPIGSMRKLLMDNLVPFIVEDKESSVVILKKPLIPLFFCTLIKLLNYVHSINDKNIASTNEEKIKTESGSIELFSTFLCLTKDENFPVSNKTLLEIFRSSNAFLLSLQKKMKLFSDCFTTYRTDIITSFKTLQNGTRQLHSLCEYVKEKGSVSFIRLIPNVKKSMESIIFSVKMLLSNHGLLESKIFNIGLLKPKDIHGNAVEVSAPKVIVRKNSSRSKDGSSGGDNSGYSTNSDGTANSSRGGRKRKSGGGRSGSQSMMKRVKVESRHGSSNDDNDDEGNNVDEYGFSYSDGESDEEESDGDESGNYGDD